MSYKKKDFVLLLLSLLLAIMCKQYNKIVNEKTECEIMRK